MTKPYRYEATIRLVIYADGQDAAWLLAKSAADAARATSRTERAALDSANTSMIDLRYAPTVRERWTGAAPVESPSINPGYDS